MCPNEPTNRADQAPRQTLVLPEWVEESLFHDFLTALPHALEELETDILALEGGRPEAQDALKRRVHTLKGEAGVLGLSDLQEVCHGIEDFLVRSPEVDQGAVDDLLTVHDWMGRALAAYTRRCRPSPSGTEILAAHLGSESPSDGALALPAAETGPSPAPPAAAPGAEAEEENESAILLHEARAGLVEAERLLVGVELSGPSAPAVAGLARIFGTIEAMAEVLEIDTLQTVSSATAQLLDACARGAPRLEGAALDLLFDVIDALLGMLDSLLKAEPGEARGRLEFSRVEGFVNRLERAAQGELLEEESVALASLEDKIGDILLQHGKVAQADIQRALALQKQSGRVLGEELVAMGVVRPKDVAHALRARKRAERRASNLSPVEIRETVKVDTERIDELIELVGELVITQSILTVAPELRRLDSPRLRSALIRLSKIARDLQGLGMHMRMVPVRGLFQKMSRATRELSRKLGRDILLATDGADTEIDRSMVERLADPLLHMIRNAVDHGIESPDERRAAGKSLRGTIWLRARQEGASIVIQVTDDGRGLDVERILRKARERGLVGPDDRLSSGQVYKLIFTAGFSTADQVSDVSGRGVGMDVVRRHIESMRGRVHVSSELGEGTTFSITLPLTLAVIDGTLVRSGPERYIIPTLSILESVRPHQGKLHRPGNGAELIILGEQSLPIVRLSEILGCEEKPDDDRDGQLLIMESLGHRLALLVDDILGHQQVVIKNLGSYFQEKRFLAGAAILSDGNVGLILNVDELATLVDERTSRLRSASVAPL